MSNIRSNSKEPLSLLALCAIAACSEPYTTDPNAGAPPAVAGVVLRDSPDIDNTEDLAGQTGANAQQPSGEASAFYRFLQNRPTPIAGPVSVYPSQFPEIMFNKLMDGSTMEIAQTDPVTGRPEGFCEPAPGGGVVMAEGSVPFPLLRTCYSPSDTLVTVQPASALNAPPQLPTDIPFLKYGETYAVQATSAIKDAQGNALPPFSLAMKVGPFALFSVTDVGQTGAQPSGPTVTTYLYGIDAAISGQVTQQLPSGTRSLRMVFTGPVAPQTNSDGTVPKIAYPGFAIYGADAQFNPGAAIRATFTTSDGLADNLPGTTDPRIVFAYPDGGNFSAGNYILSIPLSFTDNGSVTGHPVPLSDDKDYPKADAIQIQFTVPAAGDAGAH